MQETATNLMARCRNYCKQYQICWPGAEHVVNSSKYVDRVPKIQGQLQKTLYMVANCLAMVMIMMMLMLMHGVVRYGKVW